MFIMAVAAIVSLSLGHETWINIRQTQLLVDQAQAYQYALGLESWAKELLMQDKEQTKIDSLQEAWAKPLTPITIPHGKLQLKITDLQGRFNLNSLINTEGKDNVRLITGLNILLKHLELPPTLTLTLLDWIDADETVRLPEGAESLFYLLKKPAYRTANRAMASPTELRLVADVTEPMLAALVPFVTALPKPTLINVNTAPAEVLLTLSEGLSKTMVDAFITDRNREPLTSTEQFTKHPLFEKLQISSDTITVESQFYLAENTVEWGQARLILFSVLERVSKDRVNVIARYQGV